MRKVIVLCLMIFVTMILSFTHVASSFAEIDGDEPQNELAQANDKKEEPEEEEEDDDC